MREPGWTGITCTFLLNLPHCLRIDCVQGSFDACLSVSGWLGSVTLLAKSLVLSLLKYRLPSYNVFPSACVLTSSGPQSILDPFVLVLPTCPSTSFLLSPSSLPSSPPCFPPFLPLYRTTTTRSCSHPHSFVQSRYQLAQQEAYFLVAALSSIIVIALCLGNAQADTITTPLGLTQVDDKGAPITPLTYLNLEPASKELSDAAKKVTTPPPMTKQKRLAPSASDHLEPFAKQFTSQGISIRELGSSLIPSLPLLGALDNEGDHTNAKPPAEVPAVEAPAAQKRLLDVLKSLDLPDSGRVMPANQQTLDQRTSHPLNCRADDPLNLNILGKKPTELLPKLPTKRDDASGINLFGHEIPLDAIALPSRSVMTVPLSLD